MLFVTEDDFELNAEILFSARLYFQAEDFFPDR